MRRALKILAPLAALWYLVTRKVPCPDCEGRGPLPAADGKPQRCILCGEWTDPALLRTNGGVRVVG